MIPRFQLLEFNDQPWVPAPLRDTVVEALSHTLDRGGIIEALVPCFREFLDAAGVRDVLEIGAGAGGPARLLASHLERTADPARFLLTDLHPRPAMWERIRAEHPETVDFVADPVDATAVPESLASGRVRSIINVFHHFPPDLAQSILHDAIRGSRGVFLAEGFERNPLQFLNFAPAGLPALARVPWVSPTDRLAKAILTWLTPVSLAVSVWDGLVSTLRVYSEAELREMVAPFSDSWEWTYQRYSYPPAGTGYAFWGIPRDEISR